MFAFSLQAIKDSVLLAHNQEYVEVSEDSYISVSNADEIAVIPPLSGG
jgi:molybdopterin converting factor small subunit